MNQQNLQGLTKEEACTLIKSKNSWTNPEINTIITGLKLRKGNLKGVQIGDITYLPIFSGHPAIVISLRQTFVVVATMTTDASVPNIVMEYKSRILEGSYITSTLLCVPTNKIDISFHCENKTQALKAKHLIMSFYDSVFKGKRLQPFFTNQKIKEYAEAVSISNTNPGN